MKFHLFQELIDLFTAVIVLEKTNQKIQDVIIIPEMIDIQEIAEEILAEMIDILEMTDKNLQQ